MDHYLAWMLALHSDDHPGSGIRLMMRAPVDPCRALAAAARYDAIDGEHWISRDLLTVESVHFSLAVELLPAVGGEEQAIECFLVIGGRAWRDQQETSAERQSDAPFPYSRAPGHCLPLLLSVLTSCLRRAV
jgi:hypothetical protein